MNDRPAQRPTELVLAKFVESLRCEQITGVQRFIPEVVVRGTVYLVGSGSCNDVDHGTGRGAQLRPVALLDDSEFADSFLGRSRTRPAEDSAGTIGAIDRN